MTWLRTHKALAGAIVAALAAVSGALVPPYGEYLYAAAVVLAALSGGPRPAQLPPTPKD